MADEMKGRIWKPSVEPTEILVPYPGSLYNSDRMFTKTSLRTDTNQAGADPTSIASINKKIIDTTQAFNSSPKPFVRQDTPLTENSSVKPLAPGRNYHPPKLAELREQPSKEELSRDEFSEESANMAPKLVHKQYNSPLDLYSMNNIRKTIEAHSEFIAPGVKGINFMKGDGAVNKQSEVYKLVMEEEMGKTRSSMMHNSANMDSRKDHGASSSSLVSQVSNRVASDQTCPTSSQRRQHYQHVEEVSTREASNINQAQTDPASSAGPTCCECGRPIVGLFARLNNRYVHMHCFNCTTCGTSLKNSGFFTVNDKLYCYIHVKQVANMMNISYDFSDVHNKNQRSDELHGRPTQASTTSLDASVPHMHKEQNQALLGQQQVEHQVSTTTSSSTGACHLSSTRQQSQSIDFNMRRPATISTMFADRSVSPGNEVRWSWRPMTSAERNQQASQLPTSGANQFHQAPLASRITTQSSVPAAAGQQTSGGRVPTCFNCHVQIHGPYILAGKSSWCKICSQKHFNCGSCRRPLLDTGFIEDNNTHKYYCESCYETHFVPICSKCCLKVRGDCLNALGKQWHPACFVCGHCKKAFGNSCFYLEDNVPYCQQDWNLLFTSKCYACSYPIGAGDKWIEVLDRNYHANCFKCNSCQSNLEGSTFYCKNGKPYCRLHAR